MTLREIDQYFASHDEPFKGCLVALRALVLQIDDDVEENWKYRMPMYYVKGKMAFYLWFSKQYQQPYIGIVEGKKINHPELIQEKRARMKILLIDPDKDLPVRKIKGIMKEVVALYKKQT